MQKIRVLVVEDHAVVREGTRQLLERDSSIDVVGETGRAVEAIDMVQELAPDVVLLDLALPELNGIEVARHVSRQYPATKIVILSAYDDDDYVFAALEVGVAAYLLKTVRGQEVVDTIHDVVAGQVILHPEVAAKLRQSLSRRAAGDDEPVLSPRELEVLKLAAKGLYNREIADRLSISVRTVEGHLSSILTKLDASSRTEAVVYALAHGWIVVDSDASRTSRARP
jgi:two-component system, NarL family, response regulator LiaR